MRSRSRSWSSACSYRLWRVTSVRMPSSVRPLLLAGVGGNAVAHPAFRPVGPDHAILFLIGAARLAGRGAAQAKDQFVPSGGRSSG